MARSRVSCLNIAELDTKPATGCLHEELNARHVKCKCKKGNTDSLWLKTHINNNVTQQVIAVSDRQEKL